LGNFRGATHLALRTFDLVSFEGELTRLLSASEGSASFSTDEGVLSFTLLLKKTGRGSLSGRLEQDAGARAILDFTVDTDQTYLWAAARSLRDVLVAFPVKS
jgi:hypothetical protein